MLRHYFWDDPHLYKEGVEGITSRCVPEYEKDQMQRKCHFEAYGGHHVGDRTTHKVLQSGFYLVSVVNDTYGITGIPSTVGGREVVQREGLTGSTRVVYPGSGREDA